MECPYCGGDSRVLDSRGATDVVRRRRECHTCERRFTTYEKLANPEIKVLKRDGRGEPFDRDKVTRVVERVTRNRPVTKKACADLARGLEAELIDAGALSVTSGQVATQLLARLTELDAVAARRFASNYQHEDGVVRTSYGEPSPQLAFPLGGAPALVEPEVAPIAPPRRARVRKA